uniref:Uncharacterized protein n=1 Tax=Anguilla anguilla TaxID=7936 RepID=A0A0E9SU40_ANGAN
MKEKTTTDRTLKYNGSHFGAEGMLNLIITIKD